MKKLIIFCLVVCSFLVGKAQLNPPVVQFTSTLGDTVYNTGPFVITAKVASRTYAPIITPKLMYAATYNSITTYDSIVMTPTAGDSMWTATIPQHIYGTSIVYSINAFDSIGNNNYAQKGLYIQRISGGGGARVVTIQNGSGSQVVIPLNSVHNYSYTQQIYTAAELNGPGMINAIAFDVSVSNTAQQSIDVYIAHTTQNTIASAANVIPGANLTLVYSGNYTFNTTGWNTIVLQTPFLYNGTDNIVVAVDKNTGASSSGLAFYNEATVNPMAIRYYGSSDISPLTFGGTATVTNNYRPNIRFSLLGSSNDSNSVKLLSIDNPTKGTNGGLQPVRVTIKNAGIKYLDSCYVDWTLNGVLQSRTIWRGYLPEDFNDTITLGYYTQPYDMFDTIVVWVSMPNGVIDSTTYDDTLRVHSYGCYGSISGDYIVGVGAGADVPDFATAFFIGSMCGINGDVTLKFQNGVYNENWDFTDLADIMGPYTLTITSLSGNKDDVVLSPSSGVGIVLNNTNNLIIKNITINATQSNAYAIQFVGDVYNIAFLHNNIYSDTVGTSSTTSPAPIYKASSTGIADSVILVGNVIRGGYYGIYFYGGTSSSVYGTRIVIDSNMIINQYYYATYFYYCDFNSISHNKILSRTTATSTYWYGLRLYYCNYIANGNKIHQLSSAIAYPYLAYMYYSGYYNTLTPSLFCNNELIGMTSSTYYGMYVGTYNVLNIVNNTIYMSGTGASRNIYIVNSTSSSIDLKNNIIVNASSGYPIYISGTTTPLTSNYNCFYGNTNIGYITSAHTTLASWQTATSQDVNSITVNPIFINVNNNLKLTNFSGFNCYRYPNVNIDIEGVMRIPLTSMGCYTQPLPAENASLTEILNLSESAIVGDSGVLEVVFLNSGTNPISSATLNWSINNVNQPSIYWTGNLLSTDKDTLVLGPIHYQSGYNEVVVWISSLGALNDTIHQDDTIRAINYTCDSLLNGNYIVGVNGDFPDIQSALDILNKCGISGNVNLLLRSGSYDAFTLQGSINGASLTNIVTITSLAQHADSVIFSGNVPLTISGAYHFKFSYVTFDARIAGGYAVYFAGTAEDVEISHCAILADPLGTSSSAAGIYKASATGTVDNIRIIANVIDGGYYGIYFYGGTGTSDYGTNVIVDSNLITNQYYYANYFYYTDFSSVSHNTILSRTANTSTYWYGIRFYYCNFIADGNKIQQRSTAITYPYLAYIYYAGYNNTLLPSVFINNELIGTTTSTYYGIYAGTSNVLNMYHNSIYMSGTGASRSIYIVNSTTSLYDLKNNIVVNDNVSGYPIYISGTTTPLTSNYNCYYGVGYVGYFSSAHTTLASWQTTTNQDANSVNVSPLFINVSNNLELSDYSSFITPRLSSVSYDIEGRNRTILTMMGAYSTPLFEGYNLAMSELLSPVEVNDIYCFDDYTDLTVSVKNAGTENFDLSVNNLSIHVDVAGPLNFQFDTIISIGSLSVMSADTFNLTDMFPVYKAGTYQILIYVSSIIDTHYVDDTLGVTYIVKKIDLPYDEDFSVSPSDIIIKQVAGTVSWQVESGADTNPVIAPVYGSGRMAFASQSGIGSISQLIFNGLDLRGALNPKLEFWYAQDGDATENDFMLVKATTNGGVNFQVLETIYRYNASLSAPAWTYVVIDLSSYDSASCLSLVFEANSFGGANQNIDRIRIASVQDVAVRLIAPEEEDLVACNLDNQTLQMVVENMTPQAVNFDVDTTKIVLKVSGAKNLSFIYPLSGILQGLQKDTITICDTFNLSLKGNYQIEAYIQAVDTLLTNDTAITSILINPDLQINYLVGVDEVNCKFVGDTVFVSVMIENTGNLKVVQVPVSMQINGGNYMSEFFYWDLNPGESLLYDMGHFYIVPQVSAEQPYYQVKIKTELSCDADSSNNIFTITACVEIPEVVDLQLQSINKPIETLCDSGLHIVNVSVTLENAGTNDITAAVVHVEVDSVGVILASFSEVSDAILSGSTLTHVFTQGYSVPNFSGNYTVKVFVETIADDEDLTNDTLVVNACAILNDVGINDITEISWTLGQNIPNPAKSLTSIPYVVPQNGEVIFTVMSINGQILYREVIQTLAGSHRVELNTDKLSNGMYYYSMEYKGQRIVKKMTIQQ